MASGCMLRLASLALLAVSFLQIELLRAQPMRNSILSSTSECYQEISPSEQCARGLPMSRIAAASAVLSTYEKAMGAEAAAKPLHILASAGSPSVWAHTHLLQSLCSESSTGSPQTLWPPPQNDNMPAAASPNTSMVSGKLANGTYGLSCLQQQQQKQKHGCFSGNQWPVVLTTAEGPAIPSAAIFVSYVASQSYNPGNFEYDGLSDGPHFTGTVKEDTSSSSGDSSSWGSAGVVGSGNDLGSRSALEESRPAAVAAAAAPLPSVESDPEPSPSPPLPLPDAWIVSGAEVGAAFQSQLGLDLTSIVRRDTAIQWSDLLRPYAYSLYRMGGRATALPMAISTNLLYYNRAVLDSYGVAPPQTWQQLADVAEHLSGKDLDGDGTADYGLCLASSPFTDPWSSSEQQQGSTCTPDIQPLLLDIWAALVQTAGPRQGMWFTQNTSLQPWIYGAGMREALRIATLLHATGPPPAAAAVVDPAIGTVSYATGAGSGSGCSGGHLELFLNGRCAFAFAPGLSVLKALASRSGTTNTVSNVAPPPPPPLYGSLGAVPLPGSTFTWRLSTDSMEPCQLLTCPFAEPQITTPTTTVTGAAGSKVPLVNRAQFVWVPAAALLSAQTLSASRQLQVYALFSQWLSGEAALQDVLDPTSDVDPFRHSQLSLHNWVAAGYNCNDAAATLAAYSSAMSHHNFALPLVVPGASTYLKALRSLTASYLQEVDGGAGGVGVSGRGATSVLPAARVMELVQTASKAVADAFAPDVDSAHANLVPYVRSLRTWSRLPDPPAANMMPGARVWGMQESPGQGPRRRQASLAGWALAGIVLAGGFLCLAAGVPTANLVAKCVQHGWDQRVLWMGAVAPPGPSPDLTLLLSDIEGSTTLWEDLPAVVMDASVRMHAVTFRRLLLLHQGYESATEGDAFICAFSSPIAALDFSVQLQEALLGLPWPAQLLQQPHAAEVFVAPRLTGARHTFWGDTAASQLPSWVKMAAQQQPRRQQRQQKQQWQHGQLRQAPAMGIGGTGVGEMESRSQSGDVFTERGSPSFEVKSLPLLSPRGSSNDEGGGGRGADGWDPWGPQVAVGLSGSCPYRGLDTSCHVPCTTQRRCSISEIGAGSGQRGRNHHQQKQEHRHQNHYQHQQQLQQQHHYQQLQQLHEAVSLPSLDSGYELVEICNGPEMPASSPAIPTYTTNIAKAIPGSSPPQIDFPRQVLSRLPVPSVVEAAQVEAPSGQAVGPAFGHAWQHATRNLEESMSQSISSPPNMHIAEAAAGLPIAVGALVRHMTVIISKLGSSCLKQAAHGSGSGAAATMTTATDAGAASVVATCTSSAAAKPCSCREIISSQTPSLSCVSVSGLASAAGAPGPAAVGVTYTAGHSVSVTLRLLAASASDTRPLSGSLSLHGTPLAESEFAGSCCGKNGASTAEVAAVAMAADDGILAVATALSARTALATVDTNIQEDMHFRSQHQRPTSSQISPPSSLAAAESLSITRSPFGHHIAAQGQGLSEGGTVETLNSESVHRRLCDNCRGHGMSAVNRVPLCVGPHSTLSLTNNAGGPLSFSQDTVRNNITTSVTTADTILAGAAPGVAAVGASGGDVAEPMAAAATVSATAARDFKAHVLSLYQPCNRGTPGALCLYRGLRLRLGLHCCGVSRVAAAELRPNRASGRVIYGGAIMTAARAISNTGHGGAIILSEAARQRLEFSGQLVHPEAGLALYLGHYNLPKDKSYHRPVLLPPEPAKPHVQLASTAAPFLCPVPMSEPAVLPLALEATDSVAVAEAMEATYEASGGGWGSQWLGSHKSDSHWAYFNGGGSAACTATVDGVCDAGGSISVNIQAACSDAVARGKPSVKVPLVLQRPASRWRTEQHPTATTAAMAAALPYLHDVALAEGSMHLYQVVGGPRAFLAVRAAHQPPLNRAGSCVALGTLSAPVGDEVAVAELRAQGSSVLAAWNWKVFEHSLGVMATCCRDMALLHGVTLAHDGGPRAQRSTGVVVVGVGTDAAALVAWALECQAAGLELPWPAELLEHELGNAQMMQPQASSGQYSSGSCDELLAPCCNSRDFHSGNLALASSRLPPCHTGSTAAVIPTTTATDSSSVHEASLKCLVEGGMSLRVGGSRLLHSGTSGNGAGQDGCGGGGGGRGGGNSDAAELSGTGPGGSGGRMLHGLRGDLGRLKDRIGPRTVRVRGAGVGRWSVLHRRQRLHPLPLSPNQQLQQQQSMPPQCHCCYHQCQQQRQQKWLFTTPWANRLTPSGWPSLDDRDGEDSRVSDATQGPVAFGQQQWTTEEVSLAVPAAFAAATAGCASTSTITMGRFLSSKSPFSSSPGVAPNSASIENFASSRPSAASIVDAAVPSAFGSVVFCPPSTDVDSDRGSPTAVGGEGATEPYPTPRGACRSRCVSGGTGFGTVDSELPAAATTTTATSAIITITATTVPSGVAPASASVSRSKALLSAQQVPVNESGAIDAFKARKPWLRSACDEAVAATSGDEISSGHGVGGGSGAKMQAPRCDRSSEHTVAGLESSEAMGDPSPTSSTGDTGCRTSVSCSNLSHLRQGHLMLGVPTIGGTSLRHENSCLALQHMAAKAPQPPLLQPPQPLLLLAQRRRNFRRRSTFSRKGLDSRKRSSYGFSMCSHQRGVSAGGYDMTGGAALVKATATATAASSSSSSSSTTTVSTDASLPMQQNATSLVLRSTAVSGLRLQRNSSIPMYGEASGGLSRGRSFHSHSGARTFLQQDDAIAVLQDEQQQVVMAEVAAAAAAVHAGVAADVCIEHDVGCDRGAPLGYDSGICGSGPHAITLHDCEESVQPPMALAISQLTSSELHSNAGGCGGGRGGMTLRRSVSMMIAKTVAATATAPAAGVDVGSHRAGEVTYTISQGTPARLPTCKNKGTGVGGPDQSCSSALVSGSAVHTLQFGKVPAWESLPLSAVASSEGLRERPPFLGDPSCSASLSLSTVSPVLRKLIVEQQQQQQQQQHPLHRQPEEQQQLQLRQQRSQSGTPGMCSVVQCSIAPVDAAPPPPAAASMGAHRRDSRARVGREADVHTVQEIEALTDALPGAATAASVSTALRSEPTLPVQSWPMPMARMRSGVAAESDGYPGGFITGPATAGQDNQVPGSDVDVEFSASISPTNANAMASTSTATAAVGRLVYRGLRLKGAMDFGRVQATLVGSTGRLQYRGRTVERVAALAAVACSGQLLVTEAAVRKACRLAPDVNLELHRQFQPMPQPAAPVTASPSRGTSRARNHVDTKSMLQSNFFRGGDASAVAAGRSSPVDLGGGSTPGGASPTSSRLSRLGPAGWASGFAGVSKRGISGGGISPQITAPTLGTSPSFPHPAAASGVERVPLVSGAACVVSAPIHVADGTPGNTFGSGGGVGREAGLKALFSRDASCASDTKGVGGCVSPSPLPMPRGPLRSPSPSMLQQPLAPASLIKWGTGKGARTRSCSPSPMYSAAIGAPDVPFMSGNLQPSTAAKLKASPEFSNQCWLPSLPSLQSPDMAQVALAQNDGLSVAQAPDAATTMVMAPELSANADASATASPPGIVMAAAGSLNSVLVTQRLRTISATPCPLDSGTISEAYGSEYARYDGGDRDESTVVMEGGDGGGWESEGSVVSGGSPPRRVHLQNHPTSFDLCGQPPLHHHNSDHQHNSHINTFRASLTNLLWKIGHSESYNHRTKAAMPMGVRGNAEGGQSSLPGAVLNEEGRVVLRLFVPTAAVTSGAAWLAWQGTGGAGKGGAATILSGGGGGTAVVEGGCEANGVRVAFRLPHRTQLEREGRVLRRVLMARLEVDG